MGRGAPGAELLADGGGSPVVALPAGPGAMSGADAEGEGALVDTIGLAEDDAGGAVDGRVSAHPATT
jgi:hypothetical protein